mgnify:CR=1 FL=1
MPNSIVMMNGVRHNGYDLFILVCIIMHTNDVGFWHNWPVVTDDTYCLPKTTDNEIFNYTCLSLDTRSGSMKSVEIRWLTKHKI